MGIEGVKVGIDDFGHLVKNRENVLQILELKGGVIRVFFAPESNDYYTVPPRRFVGEKVPFED